MVANPGSALGEAIGKLFETAIRDGIRASVEERDHTIIPAKLKNGSDNVYQIDAVIYDEKNNPIIIIDPKYIRYKKHNRDKGSWLCVAHYNLRKTFPTIRKSISILAGRWSSPSKSLIRSFGVEILEVPFEKMVQVLSQWNIDFDWQESDRGAANTAWQTYEQLDEDARKQIAFSLTEDILDHLKQDVIHVLETDISSIPRHVSQVEILMKTDQDETVLLTYPNVSQALQALVQLVSDNPDMSNLLMQQQQH
jgi:hypothetical protein